MEFKNFIASLLRKGNLNQSEIDWVVNTHLDEYARAFTSMAYDPSNNYEDLEQKGDASANAFLVWYFYNRFPQLNCPEGVPVVARLKIVYSAKATFFKIAKNLGFWSHIRATQTERDNKEKSLLEDVFEAFVGATQSIFDNRFETGFGFVIACRMLKSFFDDVHISLEYEDLYDAKTRLKEYFDTNKQIGKLVTDFNPNTRVVTLSIAQDQKPIVVPVARLSNTLQSFDCRHEVSVSIKNDKATVIARRLDRLTESSAKTKAEAEQKASLKALNRLNVRPNKKFALLCVK